MKLLEHHDQISAACGTFALISCIDWLAERVIAYAEFMRRVAVMVASLFGG